MTSLSPAPNWLSDPVRPSDSFALLNGWWDFQPLKAMLDAPPKSYAEAILVPAFWNTLPAEWAGDWDAYKNFEWPTDWQRARTAAYRRAFNPGPQRDGTRLLLEFDAVIARARVFLNGRSILSIEDGFLPHSVDITETALWAAENTLEVIVTEHPRDSSGNLLRPAGSWCGWFLLGIWQDVRLRIVPDLRMSQVFIQTSVRHGRLSVTAELANDSSNACVVQICHRVAGEDISAEAGPFEIRPGERRTVECAADWAGARYWSPDDPHLYHLSSSLRFCNGNELLHGTTTRFGFREFELCGTQFVLNGTPIRFRGDSWHYMGAAQQSPEYARTWFEFVKSIRANAVRLHAMPYPEFYLDLADEMGICIIDECAVYGSGGNLALGDEEFWNHARAHVKRLVRRDRNHPSVCLWSASNEVVWKGGPAVFGPLLSLEQAINEEDSSRPVSFDENKSDLGGGAKIFGGHYGTCEEWDRSWLRDKPLIVNEFGCLYYSGPEEPAKWGGEECFASYETRLAAAAQEAREMILGLRAMAAASLTPWNFVWYSLWPAFPSRPVTLSPDPTVSGIKTQRIGEHSLTLNYTLPSGEPLTPDAPRYLPHPAHEVMKLAYARAGAFWRCTAHSAWAGRELLTVCDLHNDFAAESAFEVRVICDGKVLASVTVVVPPGESKDVGLAMATSQLSAGQTLDMALETWRADTLVCTDHARCWIVPPLPAVAKVVAVCDPSGAITPALDRAGIRWEPWVPGELPPPGCTVVILGPGAMPGHTLRQATELFSSMGFFHAGRRLIAWNGAFQPDATSHANPVEREFMRSWRRDCAEFWENLPPDTFFTRWEADTTRAFANGYVACAAYPKSATGLAYPLAEVADGGSGLEYSPLLYLPVENGGVALISYATTAFTAGHPAAVSLLHRLVEHVPAQRLAAPIAAISPGTNDWSAMAARAGAVCAADGSVGLLLVDANDVGHHAAEIAGALNDGQTLLVMNLTPESAPNVTRLIGTKLSLRKSGAENVIKFSGQDGCQSALVSGLSHDDFVWVRRGQSEPIVDWVIEPTGGISPVVVTTATRWQGYAEAAEQHKVARMMRRISSFEGTGIVVGEVLTGGGRVVLCQLRLSSAQTFRKKAGRITATLLRNLGVQFVAESSALVSRRSAFADENGFIRRWLMLGVFKPPAGTDIMEFDYISGESRVAPIEGETTAGRQWFPHESAESDVNLRAAFDGQILDSVAVYSAVYVFSPTARDILLDTPDMVDLSVGSEDSVRAWLNGEEILTTIAQRTFQADSDVVRGVRLRRGWNLLLLKFMQRSWDWRMSVRFVASRSGQPVDDLDYGFTPGSQV